MLLEMKNYRKNPPHSGSVELYNRVGSWHDLPIPFTKEFGWERWGLLLLVDFVLHYVQGQIVEIGIGESSIYFTRLARKYNRRVFHCDIQRSDYENLFTVPDFFDESNIKFVGHSDDFFKEINLPPIAVGFIDGGHTYNQVKKDFNNLFEYIVPNGFIFIHDMLPRTEDQLDENVCGDGYKFRQELERRGDLDIITFPFSAWNVGLTVVRKIPKDVPYFQESGRK